MNRLSIFIFFVPLLLFFLAVPGTSNAQDGEFYRVETTDGNLFIGELISENDESIVLRTETIGEITIRRDNIRRMTLIDRERIRQGEYWYENPHSTRYLFAPNATGLKRGRGYYQNTWIFFNNVNYGVTNNFSVGGGIIPLFLLGTGSTPVWFMPKVSVPAGANIHLSAGALIGGVIGEDASGGGIFYGVGTYGNSDKNVSVGLGYGYSGGEVSSSPVVNISGMLRASRRSYFVSENYLFPGNDLSGIISIGYRWAPENFAVDFALVRPLEELGSFIGIPWLGVSIPFGY